MFNVIWVPAQSTAVLWSAGFAKTVVDWGIELKLLRTATMLSSPNSVALFKASVTGEYTEASGISERIF